MLFSFLQNTGEDVLKMNGVQTTKQNDPFIRSFDETTKWNMCFKSAKHIFKLLRLVNQLQNMLFTKQNCACKPMIFEVFNCYV